MFTKRKSLLNCAVDAVSHRVTLFASICLGLCHAASAYETVVTNVATCVNFPFDGRIQIRYDIVADCDDCTDKSTRIFVYDPKHKTTTEAVTFESEFSYTSGRKLVIWNAENDGCVVDDTNFVCSVNIECSRPFPDYCAVDLSQDGPDAISYIATVPSNGWSADYKTKRLLLRKIPADSFTMQNQRQVVLTRPFYIGVYEVTQGQWEMIAGTRPSYNVPSSGYELFPVDSVTRYNVCGYSENGASFLKTLRTKYNIHFGLPTEAQWEYACRAGTSTDYNNGKNCTEKSGHDAGLDAVATYYDGETSGTSAVGRKTPNAFGLYDMHGNVAEMCADWYGTLSFGTDPVGPTKGSYHVTRGGSWMNTAEYCTSYYRGYLSGDSVADADRGFRVAVTLSDDVLTIGGKSSSLVETKVAHINYLAECDVLEFSATNRIVGTVVGRMPYYINEGTVYEGWVEIIGGLPTPVSSGSRVYGDWKLYPAWNESSKKEICFDAGEKLFRVFKDTGEFLGQLPAPQKENYEFVGWFTKRAGGDRVYENTCVADAATFYAHWRCLENVECRECVDGVSYYFSVTNGEAYIGRLGQYKWYFCAVSCNQKNPICIPSELGGFPVAGINALAFRDLAIPGVTLPDTLRTISSSAFQWCTNIFEMTIPASVTNIDTTAFYGCSQLTNLNIEADNAFYESEEGYLLRLGELILRLPGVRGDVYKIPSSCKKIGQRALKGDTMREVVLPGSVEIVADYAFSSCLYLTNVVFHTRLTTLGEGCFFNCASLRTITLPTGLVEIPSKAFYDCTNLQTIDIPPTVQVIGREAFCSCVRLTTLKLPQSVLRIEIGAFYCSGLGKIIIPSTIEEICAYAIPDKTKIVYCYPVEVSVYGQSISCPYTGAGVCAQWSFRSGEVQGRDGGVGYWYSSYGRVVPLDGMVYTNVGCYTSTITKESLINTSESFDVSWNIVSDAQVEILPREVKVGGASAEKHYDGLPLVNSNVTTGGLGFVSGECVISVVGSQTDVGVSSNEVSLSWLGNGKQSNYELEITNGTLTVLPRDVSLRVGSATKRYDGTPLKCRDVTIGGSGFVYGECTAVATGSQTAVGSSKNTVALNWAGNGKASNYSITTTEGTLTVLPAKVSADGTEPGTGSIPAGGVSKFDGEPVKYDGKGHTLAVAKLSAVTLVADTPRFSYALSSNGVYSATPPCFTNAGTHSVWYKISAANYDDYVHEARVTILPREVTLTSGSGSKKYDGKELTCHTFSVGGEGFVGDDGVGLDYKGSQLWTGSSANTFTYAFKSNTRAENYDITCANGTLTVMAPNTVTIPVGTTDVPANAFAGATNIVRVRIPATVKFVAASAFSGCTAIRSVELGNAAFLTRFDRTELTQIVFLDRVTSIPDGAASGCTADVRVTFPSTMRIRRADLLRMGFVEGVIDNFTATGDFIILNKVLLKYIGDRNVRKLMIPSDVEIIDDGVFRELFGLTDVDLPDTVEIIGESAFEGCDALPSFTFPAALTNIGARAFYECMELSAVEIDSPLESIGDEAFGGCWKLATLRLPATLKTLGRDAFLDAGTDNLKGVTLPTHVAPLTTFLPSSYANIEEFTSASGETSVRDDMFSGCAALNSVTFAGSETSIGDSAFADCSVLTEIRIPDTVARIGRRAFAGCTALELITMPSALAELKDQVFADCASLTYVRLFASVTNLGASVFSKSSVERVYLTGDVAPSANADLYTGAKDDLVTVVRAGSTGWRKAGSTSFPVGNIWMSRTIQHDTSVIAVTFDANEGTFNGYGETYATEQTTGTAYVIPAERPVRKGYRFDGWYTARTGGSQVTELTTVLAKSAQTLYARWTPSKTITVTFVPQEDGRMPDGISSVEFATGSTFGADFERHKPTRHGWAFVGWFTAPDAGDGVRVTPASAVPEVDTTLYAHWEVAKYTVVFDKNDGTGARYPQGFVYNVWTNLVANSFTWKDHVFLGWSYTPGYDGTIDFANAQRIDWNLAQDDGVTVVLYAQWSGDSYTVWYNANGGTGTMTGQTHLYGGTLPLKTNLFEREEYDFAGWSLTGGDSAQVELRDCESVSETRINPKRDNDVELYAVWIPKTLSRVTVTFDPGTGGTLVGESATRQYRVGDTYASGGSADAFPAATRTGYTLTGWWTAATGGSRIDETTVVSNAVTTLYAQWQPIAYTVRFDANGGIEKMSDQAFTYDSPQTLRKNAFTRSGYAFAGWSPTNSSTVVYADEQPVLNLTTTPNGLVTLVAQWKKVASATYAIAFFANGKSYPVDDPSWSPTESIPNKVYKLPSCTATPPSGKTRFAGWACSNGKRYDDGCLVFNLAEPGETVTMTAIWE